MQQLTESGRPFTQGIADLEDELWAQSRGGWRRATASPDWLERNRLAQQEYNSHHDGTKRLFEQELLAFEAKVRQAQDMIDEFMDADILPISKWALDLIEEPKTSPG